MPLPVCLPRGYIQQPKDLFKSLKRGSINRLDCAKYGFNLRSSTQRWATTTQRAHYEAKVENIRNIGIIAHVDAVREWPSSTRPGFD